MGVMEITEIGAKEFVKQDHAAIYIYQDNCQPCVQFAPMFLEASDKLPDVKFAKFKLPKDEASEFKRTWLKVAKDQKPYGTPTVLVFKKGKLIAIEPASSQLFSAEYIAYFVENGELAPKPVNPLLEGLTDEEKAVYNQVSKKFTELTQAQAQIEKLNSIVNSGKATEEDHTVRGIYLQKLKELSQEITNAE